MRFATPVFRIAALASVLVGGASYALAQPVVKVGDKELQFHGFMQQGVVFTTNNNFLTMGSVDGGSAEMTDGAVNVSMQVTDKLRVGTQVYARNIGQFGDGHLQLDWGFADYRFTDWIGVRGGKVKTTLGLINDTQDMEFLHTWALLPQTVYPLDLRSITIAHTGGDVYGRLASKKAGAFAYTAYVGRTDDDRRGGYRYGIEDAGLTLQGGIRQTLSGFDVRWTSPFEGLQLGYSFLNMAGGVTFTVPGVPFPIDSDITKWHQQAFYGDFQKNDWHFSGEYRHMILATHSTPALIEDLDTPSYGWFLSAAYRIAKPLELGTYYGRHVDNTRIDASLPSNHMNDPAVTARVDFARYCSVKVEGHFIDGHGDPGFPRGFYARNNANGFAEKTKMLVVRTAISF
jgi:hypothetical protein